MKKYLFLVVMVAGHLSVFSQEKTEAVLTVGQIEALFLQNNLRLIAEKLQIDMADAEIVQAKLWENPSLTAGDVNLWQTDPQFSVELSQLIQTANKRGKLVRREYVAKEIAVREFEDMLRNLKTELRKSIYETHYLQAYLQVLNHQRNSLEQLIESYKKQVDLGNVSKSELLRLQSAFFELENEANEVREESNEQQKTLKVLLNADPWVFIRIEENPGNREDPEIPALSFLLETANQSRPDMQIHHLRIKYYDKALAYEKSLRIPNVTFSAAYDRLGGIRRDFFGLGVSVDLPLFNRNQGNIKAAQTAMEQSRYTVLQHENMLQHEVAAAYNNYVYSYAFYKKMTESGLISELDDMLEIYTRNLLERNISLIEFIDFTDAYKTHKQTMLQAGKKVRILFEELQYAVGADIK